MHKMLRNIYFYFFPMRVTLYYKSGHRKQECMLAGMETSAVRNKPAWFRTI